MNIQRPFREVSSDDDLNDRSEELAAKRRRSILIALAIGAAIVIALAFWLGSKPADDAADTGAATTQVPRVTVVAARPTGVSLEVSGTGALAARREMPVGVVGEGGRIVSVLVEPGAWVKAGQILARIDRSVQDQQARSLAAQVAVARADADLAQSNLARAEKLVSNGFVSRADLESRRAARDAAVARVNVAAAQLDQAKASTARLDIRAPAAGLVLTRQVEPGQIVSGGSGVLFRIARGGEMEMQLAVNETDLSKISVGDKATVTPVGTDRTLSGKVWQVSPVVDPQTRQGVARILLSYDPALRPGAFAHATITTGSETGIVLPQSAVLSDESGSYVFIVDANDRVVRRSVTTGPVSGQGVSVTSGIGEGERVVTTAGGFLNAGDRVQPALARSGAQ